MNSVMWEKTLQYKPKEMMTERGKCTSNKFKLNKNNNNNAAMFWCKGVVFSFDYTLKDLLNCSSFMSLFDYSVV